MAIILWILQYLVWAALTCVLLTFVAQAWQRKQYRLFGFNMTAAICTIGMLLRLIFGL
jgi:hypothetical protein